MKKILLGNEAVVRGALASGVAFVSGYPGCPSAEIGDEFARLASRAPRSLGEVGQIYVEWSVNEKTALEAAIGASFSGLKSLVNMKSFGINVCSDSLLPLAYTGTKAPMVIFIGDDPSCWSSAQSEQDSRGYAYLAKIPFIEPTNVQECYDFTKLGFEISEKFNVPVVLRVTTRVAHQRAEVDFDEERIMKQEVRGEFVPNKHQFSTMPPRTLEMKADLLKKLKKIESFAEKSKANLIVNKSTSSKIGVVASGAGYVNTLEALEIMGLNIPVLKLGFFYPLPKKKIIDFAKGKSKILVVEETDPYIEKAVKEILKDAQLKAIVYGKDVISEIGETNAEKVCVAISKITGKKFNVTKIKQLGLPRRIARLCEGCPYWNVLPVLKRIAPAGTIFGGDIGCNMMGALPPHDMYDYLFAMGAGLGISHGVKKSTSQKVISIMGDGTFFHSGIAPLINAVYNKSNPVVVILDNRITAMTGHQTNPGMGKTSMGQDTTELKIEDIVKACGVKNVKTIDNPNAPESMKELESTVKDFLDKEEVSVIIYKRICALLARRQQK